MSSLLDLMSADSRIPMNRGCSLISCQVSVSRSGQTVRLPAHSRLQRPPSTGFTKPLSTALNRSPHALHLW